MKEYLTKKQCKAGAYLRLSIEDEKGDSESISIINQRTIIMEYAKKNNIQLYDYYIDDGYSGANYERPGFKRLIKDIEDGIINCVITKDMSRLGRDFVGTSNYIFKYFPEHNIRYIAILENYDTLNPNGVEEILPFKAVINDMYLKDISKKIKSVRHEMMKNGEFVSSTVPYGYKRSSDNNKKLVIDDYASSIVKRIFEMKIAGKSDVMIARILTNEGILPPDVYRGKKLNRTTITTNLWKASTIKHILKNENYIGTLIQGKYEMVSLKSKKKRLLPKSRWIIKRNVIPRIISDDIFKEVNTCKKNNNIRFRKYDYLLKGLVICADCGKIMGVRRVKNSKDKTIVTPIFICRTYTTYRNNICSMHYYREDTLNKLVFNQIRQIFIKYSNTEKLEDKYMSLLYKTDHLKDCENKLRVYNSKIVTFDKAISDLYKDRASGMLANDEFCDIKSILENDRKSCEDKILNLKVYIDKFKLHYTNKEKRSNLIYDFLKVKNFDKKVMSLLIDRIEITENKVVKIFFNFHINGASL